MNKNITVITTAYNALPYFETYLSGITALKNFDEIKLIIIYNKPNFEEQKICKYYQDKYPGTIETVLLEQRESIASSLNRGFRKADTEYVSLIDIDDRREQDSFKLQSEVLDNDIKVDLTYGDFIVVKKQGDTTGRKVETPEFDRNLFTRGCFVSPTHFYRRSLFDKIGYWDEQFKSGGDFEFQARAAAAGINFKKTDSVLLYYTKEEFSKSASSNVLQPIERTVIELRYGIFDKIDYRYYDKAMGYRIHEIKDGEKWVSITNVIPNYEKFIEERKYLLPVGKRNHFINTIKRTIKTPAKMILKPKKFLNELKNNPK